MFGTSTSQSQVLDFAQSFLDKRVHVDFFWAKIKNCSDKEFKLLLNFSATLKNLGRSIGPDRILLFNAILQHRKAPSDARVADTYKSIYETFSCPDAGFLLALMRLDNTFVTQKSAQQYLSELKENFGHKDAGLKLEELNAGRKRKNNLPECVTLWDEEFTLAEDYSYVIEFPNNQGKKYQRFLEKIVGDITQKKSLSISIVPALSEERLPTYMIFLCDKGAATYDVNLEVRRERNLKLWNSTKWKKYALESHQLTMQLRDPTSTTMSVMKQLQTEMEIDHKASPDENKNESQEKISSAKKPKIAPASAAPSTPVSSEAKTIPVKAAAAAAPEITAEIVTESNSLFVKEIDALMSDEMRVLMTTDEMSDTFDEKNKLKKPTSY